MASAKAGDSQSTGTIKAAQDGAMVQLGYAEVGNDYIAIPLALPFPAGTLAVGGIFRRESGDSPGTTLFLFRVSDGSGETCGYFAPTSPGGETQLANQPLAHVGYHYGGPGTDVLPPGGLTLNALVFDCADHKQVGPARLTIHDLFVIRLTRFDVSPTAAAPQPLVITADFDKAQSGVKSMTGFLHASSAAQPSDALIDAVHRALYRIGYTWKDNRDRLAKAGTPAVMILGDLWGGHDTPDGSKWRDYVHRLIGDAGDRWYTRHMINFIDNPACKGVGVKRIQINEIIGPSAQYRPGEILGYFRYVEQGGADGACKACWHDIRGNDTLDGILTADTHAPRIGPTRATRQVSPHGSRAGLPILGSRRSRATTRRARGFSSAIPPTETTRPPSSRCRSVSGT